MPQVNIRRTTGGRRDAAEEEVKHHVPAFLSTGETRVDRSREGRRAKIAGVEPMLMPVQKVQASDLMTLMKIVKTMQKAR